MTDFILVRLFTSICTAHSHNKLVLQDYTMASKPIAPSARHAVLNTYELLELILLHLNTGRHLLDILLNCKLVNKAFSDLITRSVYIRKLFGQEIPSLEKASSNKRSMKVPDHPISRSLEVYIRGFPCRLPWYFHKQPQVQVLFDGKGGDYRATVFWRVKSTALNYASRDELGSWRSFYFGTAKTTKVSVRVWNRNAWKGNPQLELNVSEEFDRPIMLGDLVDVGRGMVKQMRGSWLTWGVDFEQVVDVEGRAV